MSALFRWGAMRVTGLGNGQLTIRDRSTGGPVRTAVASGLERGLGQDAVRLLSRLRTTIADLQRAQPAIGIRRGAATLAAATSSQPLGLNVTPTAAALRSSSAVTVTTDTSFSPVSPTWTGLSTAAPTVGGSYNGAQGTDTLTVTVVKANGAGAGKRDLEVRTSGGALVDEFSIPGSSIPGEVFPISNGLTLSFGVGPMFEDDTFTVDVVAGTTTPADPGAAFDGGGTPLNYGGQQVGAGSFTVNGEVITVAGDDTINSVVAKISASAAGVTASFEPGSATVILTQNTVGSSPTVVVGADTSGFVAAMNLDDGVLEPGKDDELAGTRMRDVAAFASVSNGSIGVGAAAVQLNINQDTLSDVLARIEAEVSGVSAGYLLSVDRVTLDAPNVLRLTEGNTGFFTALHISPGEYYGERVKLGGVSPGARRELNVGLRRVSDDLNALLGLAADAPSFVKGFRDAIDAVFQKSDTDGGLGLVGLDLPTTGPRPQLRFSETGARRLERALRDDPAKALQVLFGDGADELGLFEELRSAVDASISIASRVHGVSV